jgi:hypothetical protein
MSKCGSAGGGLGAEGDSPDDELLCAKVPPRVWNVGYPAGKFVVKPGKLAMARRRGYCRNGKKRSALLAGWLLGRRRRRRWRRGQRRVRVKRERVKREREREREKEGLFLECTQLTTYRAAGADVEFHGLVGKRVGIFTNNGGEGGKQGLRVQGQIWRANKINDETIWWAVRSVLLCEDVVSRTDDGWLEMSWGWSAISCFIFASGGCCGHEAPAVSWLDGRGFGRGRLPHSQRCCKPHGSGSDFGMNPVVIQSSHLGSTISWCGARHGGSAFAGGRVRAWSMALEIGLC